MPVLAALAFLTVGALPDQENLREAESALRRAFPRTVTVGRADLQEAGSLLVAFADDSIAGYAVVDDVRGKDQPITYLLLLDRSLTIAGLEILAYREPYGGEIRNRSWRDQFVGRRADGPLRHGREIRNITGATISARAVTDGARRILARLHAHRDALWMLKPEER